MLYNKLGFIPSLITGSCAYAATFFVFSDQRASADGVSIYEFPFCWLRCRLVGCSICFVSSLLSCFNCLGYRFVCTGRVFCSCFEKSEI
jgi:hypothetical protein